MRNDVARFVARVYSGGALQGGGLAVAADLVLTCAHVAVDEHARIEVDVPARNVTGRCRATVIGWRAKSTAEEAGAIRDLCILRLDEPIQDFTAPVLALTFDLTGDPFLAIGFPGGYAMGIQATKGEIQEILPGGWRQLDALRQPGHAITPGFSGTPVFDERLRAFVGLVAEWADAETKTATMIPLTVFTATFPEVARAMASGLVERWRRWERSVRAEIELRAALSAPALHVPAPADRYWRNHTQRAPWHEQVEDQLQRFVSAADAVDALPSRLVVARERLAQIDCDAAYPELLGDLRKANLRSLLSLIRPLVREEDEKDRERGQYRVYNHRRANLHAMHQCAYRLTQHVEHPQFARCFLIAGRFGSGKTHFCASLLDRDIDQGGLPLPVELSGDVAQSILRAANQASSVAWRSLAELDTMLQMLDDVHGPPLNVYVLLDDVHVSIRRNESLLTALTQFIDAHTSLHSLHFVMTIQDAEYDRVAAHAEFWLRHNAVIDDEDSAEGRPPPHAAGWLFLDDLNEQARTGQAILRKALEWPVGHDETAISRRVLSHPLTATILVDLGAEAGGAAAAASLNFPEFVQHFWRRRRATLDPGVFSGSEIDEAIALIAQLVADLGENPALRDVLRRGDERGRELFGTSWPSERVGAAIEVLEHASLTRTRAEERDDPTSRRLLLLVEAFWCHRVAMVLKRDLASRSKPKKIARGVRDWFADRNLGSISEGALEFLLLLLAGDRDDPATAIARTAFAGNGLSPAAPWLAGVRLDAAHQRRFLEAGLPALAKAPDLRTTFSFLYFLRSASIPPTARLESAAHAFEAVGHHALGSYFVYFFERTLRDFNSASALARALLSMTGSEAMDVTPVLGDLAATRLIELAGDEGALDVVLAEFLRPHGPRRQTAPRDRKAWRRFYFREWLLHGLLTDLALRYSIDLYPRLVDRGWYEAARIGIARPLPLEMEREANIAIGSRYRRPLDLPERKRFVSTLERMVREGSLRDRVAASFIIRHTEPPAPDDRVVVRPEFHPLLRTLAADAALLSRLPPRALGMFEANVRGVVRFTPRGRPSV